MESVCSSSRASRGVGGEQLSGEARSKRARSADLRDTGRDIRQLDHATRAPLPSGSQYDDSDVCEGHSNTTNHNHGGPSPAEYQPQPYMSQPYAGPNGSGSGGSGPYSSYASMRYHSSHPSSSDYRHHDYCGGHHGSSYAYEYSPRWRPSPHGGGGPPPPTHGPTHATSGGGSLYAPPAYCGAHEAAVLDRRMQTDLQLRPAPQMEAPVRSHHHHHHNHNHIPPPRRSHQPYATGYDRAAMSGPPPVMSDTSRSLSPCPPAPLGPQEDAAYAAALACENARLREELDVLRQCFEDLEMQYGQKCGEAIRLQRLLSKAEQQAQQQQQQAPSHTQPPGPQTRAIRTPTAAAGEDGTPHSPSLAAACPKRQRSDAPRRGESMDGSGENDNASRGMRRQHSGTALTTATATRVVVSGVPAGEGVVTSVVHPNTQTRYYCDVCNVLMNSEISLQAHVAGDRHRRAMYRVRFRQHSGSASPAAIGRQDQEDQAGHEPTSAVTEAAPVIADIGSALPTPRGEGSGPQAEGGEVVPAHDATMALPTGGPEEGAAVLAEEGAAETGAIEK